MDMGTLKDMPTNIGEQKSLDQMLRHPLPSQRHLNQQQQVDTSNKCLLTSAVQLIDGAHNNGAPPHLRSKWNRIRERLGRIQTAGAENKQRRSSLLLGAPTPARSSRSNRASAPANSATTSHGQLSLPLPAPCPPRSVTSASISCSGRLNQQPPDPIAAYQARSPRSSSRRANLDAPPPLLLHSHSNSSSSHANAAAPGGQVLELDDWPGASKLPISMYFDMSEQGPQAGQETSEGVAGPFIPSPPPGAPSPPPTTESTQPQQQQAYTLGLAPRNLAHLQQQQQQQQQQPFLVLPEQAQASALRPSQPCPHPVSPRTAKARSCPLLTAAAPAAATATPSAAGTAAATPSAAGTAVAGFPGGGAAAAEPPAALTAACMRGLEGGDAPLVQLPQAGVLCRGHHAPTKPQVSRLARSHTYTGALDREGGSNRNSGSGDEDADEGPAFSAQTFNITDTTPAATPPPTLHALSKPEQQLPPQPQLQLSEQPLHSLQQQRVHAPLPLTIEPQPPRSPPPQDDHPAHRIRHRSWSQLSLSSSMLQQHTAPSPAPALAAVAPTGAGRPRTPEVASAPCVQPPPSKIASAPLAPTPRTSHPHSFNIFPAHKATSSSAPLFSPAATAHTPGTGGLDCASFDLIPPRPPLSPQSLLPPKRPSFEHRALTPPSPEAEDTSNTSISNTSTSTISNSNTSNTSKTGKSNTGNTSTKGVAAVGGSRPHSAAVHFTSPFRCHPDSISPPQAPPHSATIRERRCRSLCLLRSSLSLEQEHVAETQKPALGVRAGLSRSPAMLPLDAPPAASASAVAAATGASVPPIPCTMPAIKGDKKDKQPLQAQQADGSSTPAMRKVASAQELSAALAAGTAPAGLRGPGVDCSTAEHAHAAPEGARPAAQEVTRAAAQEGAHADPASSGSGSSCSPFQLLSGRSGSGRAGALWDSGCELCRCSSNSSSGNCCSRCGADTSSAKARPLSSAIHSASSRCHSSSGASSSTPSAALSSALSISAPSHLSRCSSSTTNSSSASGSFKEQPAVTAAAAALEHAGFRHSLAPADVPEGHSRAVVEPAYSGLASVPETELEVAEESVVAGSEGGVAGAAGALAAAGPDGLVRHEQQQQQQQSKEGVAGGRLGAKLLASLRVVGSVAKNAY